MVMNYLARSHKDHDCYVRVSLSGACMPLMGSLGPMTFLCVHGELVGQSILQTMMFHAKGGAF